MLFLNVGKAVLAAYCFYLIVFHFLSNMPLKEGLLYGRETHLHSHKHKHEHKQHTTLTHTRSARKILAAAEPGGISLARNRIGLGLCASLELICLGFDFVWGSISDLALKSVDSCTKMDREWLLQ